MKIDMTEKEMRATFGNISHHNTVVLLNGQKYHLTEWVRESNFSHYPLDNYYTVTLMPTWEVKSQEQILAEESVEKAKAALQASQDVLNKLKEK